MDGLKQPRAVIFDWDGTLVDTIPLLRLAHNHVRTSFKLSEWTESEFYENLRFSSRELYPKLYGDRAEEALSRLYGYYHDNHLRELRVLPDAEILLSALRDRSIFMGVVSNKKHEYLLREIEHLGWGAFFFGALGAGMAAKDKPAADPVHMILSQAGIDIPTADIWFIGDTETDLLAARAAGSPAVLVTHGQDRASLIEQHRPDAVAENCRDLLNLFISANSKQGLLTVL